MSKQPNPVSKSRVEEIQALYEDETPRSKILIIGSALDEILKRLLQCYLVARGNRDELLDQYEPVGEFKVRIELAERLGLISSQLAGDLHLVRKLRNDCAHTLENFNFETGSTKDRVDLLYKHAGSWIKRTFFEGKEPETCEEKFEFVTSIYMFFLEDMIEEMKPLRPGHLEMILYSDETEEQSSTKKRRSRKIPTKSTVK